MGNRWSVVLILLALATVLLPGCQNQPTAGEIVTKLKEVEANTEDAHAVVEFSVVGEETMVAEVWEKKPNKLKVQVIESSESDAVGVVFVTDGSNSWSYDPAKNRVVVGEIEEDEPKDFREAIQSMEKELQELMDTNDVEMVGEDKVLDIATYKLELTPREEDSKIDKITVWVDKDRWIVLQAQAVAGGVGDTQMRVRSMEFNQGLSDDTFRFEVPDGVKVIDRKDVEPKHISLDEAKEQAGFKLLVPSYLPEGVALSDVIAVDKSFIIRYNHSADSPLTITQGLAGDKTPSLNKRMAVEVTVRGQKGNMIGDEDGANTFLTWEENGVVITVAGHVGKDEALKIAESLQ